MKRFIFLAGLSAFSFFQGTIQQCTECSNDQPSTSASHKNIWQTLSADEKSSVSALVTQQLQINPNAMSNNATVTSASALRIDGLSILQANKSDVLPFLDGNATEPDRYARATVLFFDTSDGYYHEEYMVGPLPATNSTPVVPLTFPFNNQKPGRSRAPNIYAIDTTPWVAALSAQMEDITKFIWNSTILEGGVAPRLGNIFFEEDGTQSIWATLLGPSTTGFDTTTLLPLGVFFHLDVTSPQWQEWKITGWYYRGEFYNSTESFNATVFSPGFEKPAPNVDGPWATTDRRGPSLPMDDLPAPITVSNGKKRFSVDTKENFVSWMDFGFYVAVDPYQGLSLYDVRYKNQRIIYELSLQEALAHYAGSDPQQSETLYFDTFGGMGNSMVSLVKGHDCPTHATYIDAAVPDAICLFEADANYPLRRHFAIGQNYTSVAKNIVFTVRWIATVGNYDYLFDYQFYYDGSIEVHVRASGYITTAYYAGNEDYGFQIHDFLSGSLHDHVMTFKADLDVLGEANSVQKVEVVPATVEYPWSGGKKKNTMKLEKSFVTNEDEASLGWAANDAAMYVIVNKGKPNKYGEYPGYRVRRAAGAAHLTAKDSSDAGKAIHYATSDFFVTQQKDSEPRAADWTNTYDVSDPLVDFEKFLDGDSLEQEDLVLWFNLGMHHVPNTADLPNTMMTSAHSAMRLEPLNYLPGDPSVQSNQQIRVNYTASEVVGFGARAANCSVDMGKLNGIMV